MVENNGVVVTWVTRIRSLSVLVLLVLGLSSKVADICEVAKPAYFLGTSNVASVEGLTLTQ